LDQVFGGNSGTSSSTANPTTSNSSADLASALQSAKQAIADGQAALAKGDFSAYGRAQDRLKSAIAAALAAQARK
jgi:uncharacterized membrane protein (UPF0182 family)